MPLARAMPANGDDDPAPKAMDALWNLSFDDEAVERVTNGGGIERIVATMKQYLATISWEFHGYAEIQRMAIKYFYKLYTNDFYV